MGISSSLSPQQSRDQSMAPERRPSRRWELGHSLWMLWLLTLGFGSFVGIVYAGIRARQPRWIGCGLAYAIAPIGFFASPQGSTVQTVFGFGCLVTGVVAAVHAFRFRRRYLGLISGNLSATHELTSGRPSRSLPRRTPAGRPDQRQAVRDATRHLKSACDAYRARCEEARKSFLQAQRDKERAIKDGEGRLKQATAEKKLAGGLFSGVKVTLYEESVKLSTGTKKLSPETKATADTAGNLMTTRRLTLTRFALLGPFSLFAPKKTHDDKRELYMLLEDPEWAEVVKCNPDSGKQARTVAQQINLAARNLERAKQQRAERIELAKQHLESVKRDSADIDRRRQEWQEASEATSEVESQSRALTGLVESADESRGTRNAQRLLDEANRLVSRQENPASRPKQVAADSEVDESTLGDPTSESPSLSAHDDVGITTREETATGRESAVATPSGDGHRTDAAPDDLHEDPGHASDPMEVPQSDMADAAPSGDPELATNPAPPMLASARPQSPVEALDVVETLKKLSDLHAHGVLTGQEYQEKKADLLKRL